MPAVVRPRRCNVPSPPPYSFGSIAERGLYPLLARPDIYLIPLMMRSPIGQYEEAVRNPSFDLS